MARTTTAQRPKKVVLINKEWCKGCGICTALCPRRVLTLDGSGKAAVSGRSPCAGCGICVSHCPDFAITTGVV